MNENNLSYLRFAGEMSGSKPTPDSATVLFTQRARLPGLVLDSSPARALTNLISPLTRAQSLGI